MYTYYYVVARYLFLNRLNSLLFLALNYILNSLKQTVSNITINKIPASKMFLKIANNGNVAMYVRNRNLSRTYST